jgi:hypothetical protein
MNANPAPGIEGGWASANPKFSMLVGPGQPMAGPNGVVVGRFAWLSPSGIVAVGGNGRLGFIQKDQPALIVPTGYANWLPQSTMTIPPGMEVNIFDTADVWCRFAAGAQIGQTVYANYADGTGVAAAASAPSSATSTTFTIAPVTTLSCTAAISDNLMTVTAVSAGSIVPGTIISGTNVVSGTQVIVQVTPLNTGETVGGVGRYLLSVGDYQSISSETITGSYGLLTLGGTVTGTYPLGATLTGTGVSAGSAIWANSTNGGATAALTGGGGAGTYAVSPSQTASSGTVTGATNVATKWLVDTYAGANELAMISTRS